MQEYEIKDWIIQYGEDWIYAKILYGDKDYMIVENIDDKKNLILFYDLYHIHHIEDMNIYKVPYIDIYDTDWNPHKELYTTMHKDNNINNYHIDEIITIQSDKDKIMLVYKEKDMMYMKIFFINRKQDEKKGTLKYHITTLNINLTDKYNIEYYEKYSTTNSYSIFTFTDKNETSCDLFIKNKNKIFLHKNILYTKEINNDMYVVTKDNKLYVNDEFCTKLDNTVYWINYKEDTNNIEIKVRIDNKKIGVYNLINNRKLVFDKEINNISILELI